MANTIPLGDWLSVLDDEYLSTFIRDGGASVKFAVTPEDLKPELYEKVKMRCRDLDYVFVELDAAKIEMRAHMPQDIFFELSKQIDWRLLARQLVLRLAADAGYRVEGIDARAAGDVFDSIASANDLDEPHFVLRELRPLLANSVPKNPRMARDFRTAMTHLCLNSGDLAMDSEQESHPLVEWLTGRNTRLGNVRPYYIYTAINRNTARYFIESALHWVHYVGCAGTVILLDNSRVTLARRPKPPDGKRYYTKAMTMEHYELLREFIDDVDRLSGTLLIVTTNYEFLDEQSARGYGIYQALRTRIMDDVRDRTLVNPVASLVRLSEGPLGEENMPW